MASGNPKGGGARPAWDWDPRRSDAPEKAAGLVPPAVFPLWPSSILKGGIRKRGFQRGKTEGGNGLVGAARRVERERSDRSSSEAVGRTPLEAKRLLRSGTGSCPASWRGLPGARRAEPGHSECPAWTGEVSRTTRCGAEPLSRAVAVPCFRSVPRGGNAARELRPGDAVGGTPLQRSAGAPPGLQKQAA